MPQLITNSFNMVSILGVASSALRQAASIAKATYVVVPIAGVPISGAFDGFPVRIFNSKYSETGSAAIAEQLLLDMNTNSSPSQAGGKAFVTDNVAPRPRQFKISGYIAPLSYYFGSTGRNYLGIAGSVIDTTLFTPTVNWQVDLLWSAFYNSRVISFKDSFGRIHYNNIAIENMAIRKDPKIENVALIDISCRELFLYNQTTIGTQSSSSVGQASSGSFLG
jgi:hypothetical protein